MSIFISHSRKDADLVGRVKQTLGVLGETFTPIVYEELAEKDRRGPDWDNIGRLIREADIVLLFHTSNVESTRHTQAWVAHEAAVASHASKPLVVFQIAGKEPSMPLTYWTDLMVIDPDRPEAILQIQDVVSRHYGRKWRHSKLVRGAGGGALGAVLGPLGAALGIVAGLLWKPKHPLDEIPILQCVTSKVSFRYWVKSELPSHCPHCLVKFKHPAGTLRGLIP